MTAEEALEQQCRESYRTLEPCGHPKNFLIGDEYGHFTCTVCAVQHVGHEARIDELRRIAPHTITDVRAYVNDRIAELEAQG